ncbi:efflux RND transporter periplasmic adaptor subunit [Methylococcus sp. EFPC2]|uniref:efflux RND transporter periplasmic adaptor subunit n=1 Tax=Methylococcus sp. EFPC2 TaxID=2812648 RepID=UPI001967CCCD|nr:efflux RND transporter periplasmic adaptor subunit [Methylococcus sp. EFPC2]QSA98383.1 efflux RND transporter periplasmic adaptor subunit [Methylococcus sp. EFPC2]
MTKFNWGKGRAVVYLVDDKPGSPAIRSRRLSPPRGVALTMVPILGLAIFPGTAPMAKDVECLIEPKQVVELRSSVAGLIERVNVDRGDLVKKGQVLVELDSGSDRAKLDMARYKAGMQGALRAAQSRLEFAGKKRQRQQDLYQEKFATANDYDEAETGQRLADAELAEAKDNTRLAQLEVREHEENLRLKTIRSPFNGVVIERLHNPGEAAQIDDRTPVVKLAEIDPLYVEVVLPVSAIGKVQVGEEVEILPEPAVKPSVRAHVKVVDQVVDAASSTFGVRLELPNPQYQIPAGIRCQARFKNVTAD